MLNIKTFFQHSSIIKIVFFGFLLRLAFFFFLPQEFGDTQTFQRIGEEIFSFNIVNSTLHMPGYGIWIYITNFLSQNDFGYIIGDILLSTFTIFIIYFLTQEIFDNTNIAKISAIIFAIYPFSIFYSISGLTETLFVFLFFSAVLLLYKEKIIFSFILFILSIYVKSTADIISPFIIIIFFLVTKKFTFKRTFYYLSLYFLVYIILLSPWWFHNFIKYNSFVKLNLAANYHLYSGNNPKNKTGGGIGGIDVDHTVVTKNENIDLLKIDKKYKEEAIKFIKENPYIAAELSLKKFIRFWNLYPYKIPQEYIPKDIDYLDAFNAKEYNKIEYKIISIISYGLILFLSLIFVIFFSKKNLKKILPFLTMIFLLTFIHIVTIASIRYRYPIEPILIIFASFVINKILIEKKIIK
tara:strand:+ start:4391 stop:5620 length:1230 start_codon:yes stop_codon:yes gene_type:complete